jgi:hypothetical protein
MKAYKPAVKVYGEPAFYRNGQTFATYEEARKSAANRAWNWTMVERHRVDEVDTAEYPINYKWVDGEGDVHLTPEEMAKAAEAPEAPEAPEEKGV